MEDKKNTSHVSVKTFFQMVGKCAEIYRNGPRGSGESADIFFVSLEGVQQILILPKTHVSKKQDFYNPDVPYL